MSERPGFSDDLAATLAEAWRLLARGVADRRHAFHHPAVATTGLDGRPRLRTVVLRGIMPAERGLRFHTDRRSEKVEELVRDPRAALLFYDEDAKAQVRIEGRAELHTDDMVAEMAWAQSRPMSRACYGTEPAPGRTIASADAFALPAEGASDCGRPNFRAVVITADRLEWLWLAHGGHRRARFAWSGDGRMTAEWLAP